MPLFEYRCRDCGKRFEEFVLGDARPKCPGCESRKLQKLLSAFAVGSGNGKASSVSESVGSCGSCGDPRGPGACSTD
jgi:putative FmdB family regulatory protein